MTCDHGGCQTPAVATVYAAYDADAEAIHPTLHRYPAPMFKSCRNHIMVQIELDQNGFGATSQYVIQPVRA